MFQLVLLRPLGVGASMTSPLLQHDILLMHRARDDPHSLAAWELGVFSEQAWIYINATHIAVCRDPWCSDAKMNFSSPEQWLMAWPISGLQDQQLIHDTEGEEVTFMERQGRKRSRERDAEHPPARRERPRREDRTPPPPPATTCPHSVRRLGQAEQDDSFSVRDSVSLWCRLLGSGRVI